MKYNIYVEDVSVEAVFNKMDGVSGAKRFLAGELILVERPKPEPAPLFTFERNEHGHVVLTFTGLDLAGVAEIERLEKALFRVGDYAKSCFVSERKDSYDKHHRLEKGRVYKVALMFGNEIKRDSERTTANLRKRGMEHYGYGKPLGGLIPRVREVLSDEQMKQLGIFYAAALHDPIADSDGDPNVLHANRSDGGRWVSAGYDSPEDRWDDRGAFVFPLPAK